MYIKKTQKKTNRWTNAWKESTSYRWTIDINISDTWIEHINSNGLERKEKAWHGMTWNGETKK